MDEFQLAVLKGNILQIERLAEKNRYAVHSDVDCYGQLSMEEHDLDEEQLEGLPLGHCSPLMVSVVGGHPLAVAKLIELGADIDYAEEEPGCGHSQLTALHWAAFLENREDAMRVLLKHGADPTIPVVRPDSYLDETKVTPRQLAEERGNFVCYEMLRVAEQEPQRAALVAKSILVTDAAHRISVAARKAKAEGKPQREVRRRCIAAAPFLRARIVADKALPSIALVGPRRPWDGDSEEEERLAILRALLEEKALSLDLVKELCDMMTPKWGRE